MTEKVLLLSWVMPPKPAGTAVSIGNIAKQFTNDEMVVAGMRPVDVPPIDWDDNWPQLVSVGVELPARWRGRRWWTLLQFPLMLLRTLLLVRQHRCSAIATLFPNEMFLLIGYLASRVSGAKFFPIFHNTYVENRSGLSLSFAEWLQPRVFEHAEHLFAANEGMVELYRERYPGFAWSALWHPFNEPIPTYSPLPDSGPTLRLTILGSINESCRDATVRACEAIFQTENIALTFLTGTPSSYLEELGIVRDGVIYDTVSRDEVISRLQEADIVGLPHGFTGGSSEEEYRTIFPVRTTEYLLCGRPILAHSPPDSFLTRWLEKHRCALIVDEPSVPKLMEAIERLRSDRELRAELVRNALKAAEQFHAPNVAAHFRSFVFDNSREHVPRQTGSYTTHSSTGGASSSRELEA